MDNSHTNWITGIDVSQWQGDLDWKVASQTAKFAFIRCSIGARKDIRFERNWELSGGLLPRGSYHAISAPTVASFPIQEAAIRKYMKVGELPPVLDVETNGVGFGLIMGLIGTIVVKFGVYPIIYTRGSFWNGLVGIDNYTPTLAKCGIWAAGYKMKKPEPIIPWSKLRPTEIWWDFWQFTELGDAQVYGCLPWQASFIDINYFPGSVDDLKEKYKVNTTPTTPPSYENKKLLIKIDVMNARKTPEKTDNIALFLPKNSVFSLTGKTEYKNNILWGEIEIPKEYNKLWVAINPKYNQIIDEN